MIDLIIICPIESLFLIVGSQTEDIFYHKIEGKE